MSGQADQRLVWGRGSVLRSPPARPRAARLSRYYARSDPPPPPPHVISESRGGLPFSQLLLIKPETPCDEMLEGCGGNPQSTWTDMIPKPIKPLRNPSDKGLLGMFG